MGSSVFISRAALTWPGKSSVAFVDAARVVQPRFVNDVAGTFPRRALLLPLAAALVQVPTQHAAASSLNLSDFKDKEHGTLFGVPTGWTPESSELQDGRALIAASDPSDTDFNVFIAYTPIRGDYNSLGSFG